MANVTWCQGGVKGTVRLADKGYYSTNDLIECETNHIETYVPKQKYTGSIANPWFQAYRFQYDQEQDVYIMWLKDSIHSF